MQRLETGAERRKLREWKSLYVEKADLKMAVCTQWTLRWYIIFVPGLFVFKP